MSVVSISNTKFLDLLIKDQPGSGQLWGYSSGQPYGELGCGDFAAHSTLIRIGSANNWVDVFDYFYNVIGIQSDGSIWTWGQAGPLLGQGPGSQNVPYPVLLPQVKAKNWTLCPRGFRYENVVISKEDGSLWGWGYPFGSASPVDRPTQFLQFGTGWKQVMGLSSSGWYGVKEDGTLWVWGALMEGNIHYDYPVGTKSASDSDIPVQIGDDTDWHSIQGLSAGGKYSVYAIKNDGTLWVWGTNVEGQLGVGHNNPVNTPTQVPGNWAKISFSRINAVGIQADGSLWSWGANDCGQLGNGTTTASSSPVQVSGKYTYAHVTGGGSEICVFALRDDGALMAWGTSSSNLGLGATTQSTSPARLASSAAFKQTNAAFDYVSSFALDTQNRLWVWGSPQYAPPFNVRLSAATLFLTGPFKKICQASTGKTRFFIK